MSAEAVEGREASDAQLRAELREARDKLDALVGDLRAVDLELDSLREDQERYELLASACRALEQLETIGAGDLFWSELSPQAGESRDPVRHLSRVRSRIAGFEKQLDDLDERRQVILEAIEGQEDHADLIAGDVLDAERTRAARELEWLVEREDVEFMARASIMPWVRGGDDDRRFRKTLAVSLALSLLLALLLPMIEIPIPERWEILEEQDRLTQLIREELPPPTPREEPQALAESEPEAVNEPEETPLAAEEVVPESAPAATQADEPSPASKGLLAFRESFTGLTDVDSVDRLGSNARISNPADIAQGLPQRSMVVSQASSSSGGINVASLSRDTGGSGQQIGGVAIARATSSIGTGTGAGGDRPLSGGGPGLGRTDEEIQIVFDRHKAALYRLYNRALRENPTLKGQIVLRMTIEPDGSVSSCIVKSSDMKAPQLGEQVVTRVKTFDFGAKEGIPAVTIVYPIDFLPAT